MWFEDLTGFKEINHGQVQGKIKVEDGVLKSLVNGRQFNIGCLEIPTLGKLKELSPPLEEYNDKIKIAEVVGDVQQLHKDIFNSGAVFQVASQFNLLEMVGPSITPEKGVGIYQNDKTQGPACAIACGAGTVYRNYFVPVNGQIGQTRYNQIDCLEELGKLLGNNDDVLWEMKNGYALASLEGLQVISDRLKRSSSSDYEDLKNKLKIGIQWDTEVTISQTKHKVTQAYCSALPVAYSGINYFFWEEFAKLILEASYEATFYAALVNYKRTGNDKLFLTQIGGGAFGNQKIWIHDAIKSTIYKFKNIPLNVYIVSHRFSNSGVVSLINSLNL